MFESMTLRVVSCDRMVCKSDSNGISRVAFGIFPLFAVPPAGTVNESKSYSNDRTGMFNAGDPKVADTRTTSRSSVSGFCTSDSSDKNNFISSGPHDRNSGFSRLRTSFSVLVILLTKSDSQVARTKAENAVRHVY